MEFYIPIVIVAFLAGFAFSGGIGRLKRFSWSNCTRAMLVASEKGELSFEDLALGDVGLGNGGEKSTPAVRIGFTTTIFNLKSGRSYFGWRRFREDQANQDLAATIKAFKYKAWIELADGKINLSPTFDKRKGLLLHLPPWRKLKMEELQIKEEFLVPLLSHAYLSGAIAAVGGGGIPQVQTIAFDNIKTLRGEDFTFSWSRIPQERDFERVIHSAAERAEKFSQANEGFGGEAEDHPLIKAARLRLNQPRSAETPAGDTANAPAGNPASTGNSDNTPAGDTANAPRGDQSHSTAAPSPNPSPKPSR